MEKILIYIDGASKGNPGKSAYGIVIFKNEKIYKKIGDYIGITTNNIAEYLSLIFALIECLPFRTDEIEVRSDSQLLVKQITGEYKVRDEKLLIFHKIATFLFSKYNNIKIIHINREENKIADELANSFIENNGLF
ncbi:MAG TPA: ribonuclease HI family protein [bacterium]|nr:ribonuclease HI family protein [bacterium]HOM26523.1 ribonuclease HI family protein [bacterium]